MARIEIRRATIKLGTKVVSGKDGQLRLDILSRVIKDIAEARERGQEILLVSSGAIGLGKRALKIREKADLPLKQACAAVGQNLLMNAYQSLFSKFDLSVAQVLVTAEDLADRRRYLNLREMLKELLKRNVIPIINENDSVSTMEIEELGKDKVFGDNDKLSALVASKLGSDLLILLTDVDGIYEDNPNHAESAKRMSVIHGIASLESIKKTGKSSVGRGGMAAKIDAIRLASLSGLSTIVSSGEIEGVVGQALSVTNTEKIDFPCTYISPSQNIRGRTHWIGFSSGIEGTLTINRGAQRALEEKKASLLPVGVTEVNGRFNKGDVVRVQSEDGTEVARGIVEYSDQEAREFIGMKSEEIIDKFGKKTTPEVIHRDKLAVFQERSGEEP